MKEEEARAGVRGSGHQGGRSMEPVARSVHSSGMRSVDAGILPIRGCRSTSYALRCQPCRLRAGSMAVRSLERPVRTDYSWYREFREKGTGY